jgi:Flp pilus assembly protein TadD
MVVDSLDAKGFAIALGSGVVISPGRVVTNRHVIEDGISFRVEHDGKIWPATLVKVDPDHDLAELLVIGLAAPAVQIRDSAKLAVGEKVYTVGAPEGLELTISEGLISGLRDFDTGRVIQTSAAFSHGSSGGGLFDAEGRLVGVTTFFLKEGQSLNFALPAEWTLALDRQPASVPPATSPDGTAFDAMVSSWEGYTALQAADYSRAVSAFKQCLRLEPSLAEQWYNLGSAYHGLGQYDQELAAELEAIRLKPDLAEAWSNLGNTYGTVGKYDLEMAAEREAIRLNPDLASAWNNLGIAYNGLKQYEEAVDALREAARLKTDSEMCWYNLGTAYRNLGRYDQAVSALREALRLKPDDAGAWFVLGSTYNQQHQRAEIGSIYDKLKSLDPKLADEFFKAVVLLP